MTLSCAKFERFRCQMVKVSACGVMLLGVRDEKAALPTSMELTGSSLVYVTLAQMLSTCGILLVATRRGDTVAMTFQATQEQGEIRQMKMSHSTVAHCSHSGPVWLQWLACRKPGLFIGVADRAIERITTRMSLQQ